MNNDTEKQKQELKFTQEFAETNTSERSDKPRARYERIGEIQQDNAENAVEARAEALENAISAETNRSNELKEVEPESPSRSISVGKKERKISYECTMKEVQGELSMPARTFSKVIHNRFIETSSEVLGKTIARPNAMLAGSLTAFILTFAVYMVAKTIGYPLSGSETMIAFIIGWVIGILFDYFKVLITGKK